MRSAVPPSDRRQRLRVEILLAMLVVVLVGPLVHEYRAQQASRYTLTAAIWDEHTLSIDVYAAADPPVLGVDKAVKDGHVYSDKAPLQPFLAVPFYATYRAVGGEPATVRRLDENLGLWWLTFWMAALPAAVLAVLMLRFTRRYWEPRSLPGTIALFAGSMLLPFAALLFGHMMATLFLFAAFLLVSADVVGRTRLLAGGLLAGAAVATDYTAIIGVIVIAGYLIWRARAAIGWYVLGGVPAMVLLGWYHNAVFGSPLAHPYRYSAFNDVTREARGFFAIFRDFSPIRFIELVFDGRGFLFASPVVIVSLVGLALLWRQGDRQTRAVAIVGGVMFGAFMLIPLFWANPWGGDSPGPRYMTPALPFLVAGMAVAWSRIGLWARAATVIGTLTMGLATLTQPLLSDEARVSIGSWLDLLVDGEIVPTIFTIAIGPFGWLIHLGLIAGVGLALTRAHRDEPSAAGAAA